MSDNYLPWSPAPCPPLRFFNCTSFSSLLFTTISRGEQIKEPFIVETNIFIYFHNGSLLQLIQCQVTSGRPFKLKEDTRRGHVRSLLLFKAYKAKPCRWRSFRSMGTDVLHIHVKPFVRINKLNIKKKRIIKRSSDTEALKKNMGIQDGLHKVMLL